METDLQYMFIVIYTEKQFTCFHSFQSFFSPTLFFMFGILSVYYYSPLGHVVPQSFTLWNDKLCPGEKCRPPCPTAGAQRPSEGLEGLSGAPEHRFGLSSPQM